MGTKLSNCCYTDDQNTSEGITKADLEALETLEAIQGQTGLAALRDRVHLGASIQQYATDALDRREEGQSGLASMRDKVLLGASIQLAPIDIRDLDSQPPSPTKPNQSPVFGKPEMDRTGQDLVQLNVPRALAETSKATATSAPTTAAAVIRIAPAPTAAAALTTAAAVTHTAAAATRTATAVAEPEWALEKRELESHLAAQGIQLALGQATLAQAELQSNEATDRSLLMAQIEAKDAELARNAAELQAAHDRC